MKQLPVAADWQHTADAIRYRCSCPAQEKTEEKPARYISRLALRNSTPSGFMDMTAFTAPRSSEAIGSKLWFDA